VSHAPVSALVLAIALAGCPGDARVGGDGARDTVPGAPPVATPQPGMPAGQQVVLEPREGSAARGTATITPQEAVTVITASIESAPPNDVLPVRLHSGTCADEGPVRADLNPIRTDARGAGEMQAQVELPAHEILTGQHYIHVFVALDEPHRGIACGDVPARPDLHPGLGRP